MARRIVVEVDGLLKGHGVEVETAVEIKTQAQVGEIAEGLAIHAVLGAECLADPALDPAQHWIPRERPRTLGELVDGGLVVEEIAKRVVGVGESLQRLAHRVVVAIDRDGGGTGGHQLEGDAVDQVGDGVGGAHHVDAEDAQGGVGGGLPRRLVDQVGAAGEVFRHRDVVGRPGAGPGDSSVPQIDSTCNPLTRSGERVQ